MKTVKLSAPVVGARWTILEFRFREPTFEDLCELGEPETPIFQNGAVLFQQHMPIIGLYAEKLLVDADLNLLKNLPLRDGLKVRDCIVSFFREAEKAESTSSAATQTISSSSSNGTQEASGA